MRKQGIHLSSFTPGLGISTKVGWFSNTSIAITLITREEREQTLMFQVISKEIFG